MIQKSGLGGDNNNGYQVQFSAGRGNARVIDNAIHFFAAGSM